MWRMRAGTGRTSRDEAEKPFWISFADLMSALMVLFLIVMVVLLANFQEDVRSAATRETENQELRSTNEAQQTQIAELSRRLDEVDAAERVLEEKRQTFLDEVESVIPPYMNLNRSEETIDWGSLMTFEVNQSNLSAADENRLRQSIKPLIEVATQPNNRELLENFEIVGYASPEGDYLTNLNLSLDRGQRVICALLDESPAVGQALTRNEMEQVAKLFLPGGFSSNEAIRGNREASRRVELRIAWKNDADKSRNPGEFKDVGTCALG